MRDARVMARGPGADLRDRAVVDAVGEVRLVFRAVDRGVGSRIDDDIGARLVERARERAGVGEVRLEHARTVAEAAVARRRKEFAERRRRKRATRLPLTA